MRVFFEEYSSKKIWLGLYYLALILVLSAWGDGNTSPNITYKVVYFICLIIPALMRQTSFIPTLVVGFSGIALYGYAYSFMPTYLPIYLASLLIIYMFFVKDKVNTFSLPKIVIAFCLYTLFVDIVMNMTIENITYSLLIIFLLGKYLNNNTNWNTVSKYSSGLALTTIVLSAYFVVFQDRFAQDYYAQGSSLERSGWMDPNYFGMVIGMGTVASMIQLTRLKELGLPEKIFYIATIVLSLVTLVLNASRGSILAVAVSFAIIVLFSGIKGSYKFITLALTFGFVIYLYNNSYFDLLEYRILNDSGTGSGRSEIWEKKLDAFINGDKLAWFIGYGNVGGKELGMSSAFGSHNDYVAILCAYGGVGLLTFISMILYPIAKLKKYSTNKILVYAATVYIIVMCMTLEPYTAGRLPYFSYFLYCLLLMSASNKQNL